MAGLSKRKLFGLVLTTKWTFPPFNSFSRLLTTSRPSFSALPRPDDVVGGLMKEQAPLLRDRVLDGVVKWTRSDVSRLPDDSGSSLAKLRQRNVLLFTSVTLLMSNNFNQAIIIHLTCPSSPEDWHSYQDLSQNNQSYFREYSLRDYYLLQTVTDPVSSTL